MRALSPLSRLLPLATLFVIACVRDGPVAPTAPPPTPTVRASLHEQQVLPWHLDLLWTTAAEPMPAGRCTDPLPAGMTYLMYFRLAGTFTSTHLGKGVLDGSFCVYGRPPQGANPPVPLGYQDGRYDFRAASGDHLYADFVMSGLAGPQQITEAGTFTGGTGRFATAEGEFRGVIDAGTRTEVFDGWIRFGR